MISFFSRGARLVPILAASALAGCGIAPPKSPLPDAEAALARMRDTGRCGTGVHANAKIDDFSKRGRVRGSLLMFASTPSLLRMDAISPFGVTLATLTADGKNFALSDLREKHFYVGPATACNIARLIRVPIPPHALVSLLRGQAPVVKHEAGASKMAWNSGGYYVVKLTGNRNAEEEIHLAPHPDDFALPWNAQRMRVIDVALRQDGFMVYHAEMKGHAPAPTDVARVDDLGIDPPIPPSGPECRAELPRSFKLQVPSTDEDVLVQYDDVKWNPPLPEGVFTQQRPPGLDEAAVVCE